MIVILVAFVLALAIGVAASQRITVGAALLGILAIVALTPPAPNPTVDLYTTTQESR